MGPGRRGRPPAGRLRGHRDRPDPAGRGPGGGRLTAAGRPRPPARSTRPPAVTFPRWTSSTDLPLPCPRRGAGGDHRRLRRCAPRATGPSWPSCGRGPRRGGLATAVVTFDRHPATVVRPESAPLLLCDLDQKLELLEAAGVDRTVVVRFDERAGQRDGRGVRGEHPGGRLGARLVVVGEDFHFGHGRKGNVALLARDGRDGRLRGGRGAPCSPTRRGAGSPGRSRRPGSAAWWPGAGSRTPPNCSGRPHQVRGPVVHGDHRGGTELGFPTANVDGAGRHLPAGRRDLRRLVRAARRTRWPAAVSVGRRPTFYERDGRPAGRGLPARLRRRPLRGGGPSVVRVPPA